MKIILWLLLVPFSGFSQKPNINTIVIPGTTMEKATMVLIDKGYMIGAATPNLVTTVPKKSANQITIVFQILIHDSTGFLQGTYDGKQIVPGLWEHSESYAGHYKGGSFKIMDSLAKAIGQPVTYIKKGP